MKRLVVAAIAACLAVPLAASSAQAASGAAPGEIASGASTFGGYLFLADPIRHVSSSLVQPAVTCSAQEDSFASFSIGLGTESKHLAARVGAIADCRGGVPVYFGWMKTPWSPREHLGRRIEAGDSLSFDLSTANGQLSASITNNTRGWGVGSASPRTFKSTVASVGVSERADGSESLANFAAAHFTAVRLDGKPVDGQTILPILMQTVGGLVKAKPSKLTPEGNFRVTWLHK